MHGPYTALIQTPDRQTMTLTENELAEAADDARRFYQDATPALAEGAMRCAIFYAAALLNADETAEVTIVGWVGSGKSETPQEWQRATVRRDDRGEMLSTLGSRFNERKFVGV